MSWPTGEEQQPRQRPWRNPHLRASVRVERRPSPFSRRSPPPTSVPRLPQLGVRCCTLRGTGVAKYGRAMTTDGRAAAWRTEGGFFDWAPSGDGPAVRIFHGSAGPATAPVLLLVHGFPTSSIDWFDIVPALSDRFRVCWLDFPGYGFSDKPVDFPYSLQLDADLLDHFVGEVIGTDRCTVVAHDRGDSVALILHERCASATSALAID